VRTVLCEAFSVDSAPDPECLKEPDRMGDFVPAHFDPARSDKEKADRVFDLTAVD